ncbi:IS3 family transposase [Brevibacillus centrosporus]|uniref:IS3 family transposase n=1 Tax=Brevibacillus centrosporus TaxID=54910 RepID=UPI00399C4DD4
MKDLIQAVYKKYDGKYGYRQIQLFLLHNDGVWFNHKKVLRLMQEMGLCSRICRKHRSNYASSVRGRVTENILQRNSKQMPQIKNGNRCHTVPDSRYFAVPIGY